MADRSFSLLLVDDETDFLDATKRWMERKGHRVATASGGAQALELCRTEQFDVALLDLDMPGMSGIELLQRLGETESTMETIMLTGRGSIDTAVQAMKLGACDFLTKPCPLDDVEHRCFLAVERSKLRKENRQLKAVISRSRPKHRLVGETRQIALIRELVDRVAPTDKPVLISGESGTGKEVIANLIQQRSSVANRPFVTVNCAALPEQLVESELFGHEKGSFTGATSEKPGLFEVADGGTLFIDELGELPLALQPKLLRVLEDGSMRRIGSAKERRVHVRIIAATNRKLQQLVAEGKFREDLFYRVNVLSIDLPPLRERPQDISMLVDHFLPKEFTIDHDARTALVAYRWPGNVRELINVLQRATILADNQEITLDDLPREILNPPDTQQPSNPTTQLPAQVDISTPATATIDAAIGPRDGLDQITKKHVMTVLQRENGNKARAARALGIHRRKLYRLLERFDAQQSGESQPPSEAHPSATVAHTTE